MKMQIDAGLFNLEKRSKSDRFKLLTKSIPNLTRDAELDCRQLVGHYDMIVEQEYWREIEDDMETYFQKYFGYPTSWFEYVKLGISCLDSGDAIPLSNAISAARKANAVAAAKMADPTIERLPGAKQGEVRNPTGSNQYANNENETLLDNRSDHYGYPKQDRSVEYLAQRIAESNPEVHQRMERGEYPSVRAAAVDAGIVKPRASISWVPSDDFEENAQRVFNALCRKLSGEELDRLSVILQETKGEE